MEHAELIRPLVKAGRSLKASSATARSPRMQLAAMTAKGPRTAAEDEGEVQVYRYLLIVYLINNYVLESRR